MSIIQGNAKQASTRGFYSFPIEQSLRFNDDDGAYLSKSMNTVTGAWTLSMWIKRTGIGKSYDPLGSFRADEYRFENDALKIESGFTSSMLFRDPSAWYHLVFSDSGSNQTVYVNGESIGTTGFSRDFGDSGTVFGRMAYNSTFFDGYLAEVNFIDGTALDADSFGELKNGVWIPKDPSGLTYGTNGFRLSFADDAEVEAFNTVLWRGDGTTKQSVTGMGFQPDLVWAKQRSSGNSHILFDAVRGFGSGKGLQSQNTAAEGTNDPSYGFVSSADSDGFTVNEGTVGDDYVNASGQTYVAWGWDAGANNTPTGHSSVTYTGNGTSGHRISGLPFAPDLVWLKERNDTGDHHLFDTVRGVPNFLASNKTDAENTTGSQILSFTKDGFTLNSGGGINESGQPVVAWAWDAGDSDPVSNTDGSITSTVKASAANGFSIVSYTGNSDASKTIGHGLGTVPSMIIVKGRNTAQDWIVYHSSNTGSPETQRLYLNGSHATDTVAWWNDTAPTSSVFSVSNFNGTGNAYNYIAYCFSEVSGYSKFGSYEGNNTATGSTVSLGFRPGFVMIKNADGTGNWNIFDGSRFPFADNDLFLRANLSAAEVDGSGEGGDAYEVEFTDTGFIPKASGASSRSQVNGTGTYIYMAFAGSYSDYITDYNTDGSIDSRVKANDTHGFSIVSFTTPSSGSFNFGHGLSSAPNLIISKSRTGAYNWPVYHSSIGAGNYLLLNTADASAASTTVWGNTTPSSSVVYSDAAGLVGDQDYIAYCWSEVSGYSSFGSYTGTGSNLTINFGFKPAFFLTKSTSAGDPWVILDATRETVNDRNFVLQPNSSAVEDTDNDDVVEFTSTGVIIKSTSGWSNRNGINYIYAAFADTREAAFWLDQTSNDNDWQPVNLDHNDTLADSPTDNFATLNPLVNIPSGTLSNGNLEYNRGSTASHGSAAASFTLPTTGKWYWEVTASASANNEMIGVANIQNNPQLPATGTEIANGSRGDFGYRSDGNKYNDGSQGAYGATYTSGDVIGVAWDSDGGTLTFYKNNSSQGTAFSSITQVEGKFAPAVSSAETSADAFNFGQLGFTYTPPTGFNALSTANLPDPVIDPAQGSSPEDYFNTVLWTGDGTSDRSITTGHQPDFVWTKERNSAINHIAQNSISGTGVYLHPNTTAAEQSASTLITSFDSDGFTIGNSGSINGSSDTYVAWSWKANGSGVSNTDGSITSSVSANTTSGFSIVSYTGNTTAGATVGHGLSQTPEVIIVKNRTVTENWAVSIQGITGVTNDSLWLNLTNARYAANEWWDGGAHTSSVFEIGYAQEVNYAHNYIAYCFHSVEGFSKFGSYTGNGSADGPFVYTGFRPAFVMVKSVTIADIWCIWDSKREGSLINENPSAVIHPNLSQAESKPNSRDIDWFSNGFKATGTDTSMNGNGATHIYMAFAENPFKYSNAR